MADETKNTPPATPAEAARAAAGTTPNAKPAKVRVHSTETVDFPSLGWGIHKDTETDLPDDPEAQKVILKHKSITKVTK